MTKAKPFLQHSTSCTIWLGPKAMGGGFNDRADVQRTCRGMLGRRGGWAKKNTHQVFGLERLHKVSCAVGARLGSQTHVYNKRQVTKAKVCVWKVKECTLKYLPTSQRESLHSIFNIQISISVLTCLVIINNIFLQTHQVDNIGTPPKYSDMEIQSSWQICTAASVGCRDE